MVNDVVIECPYCKATVPASTKSKYAQRCAICYGMFKLSVRPPAEGRVIATKARDDE